MERRKFSESERICEVCFVNSGPWWHLYTPGMLTKSFLLDDSDYTFVMNLMARTVYESGRVTVCSFVLMSNHIHIVISGASDDIECFWAMFKRKLQRYLSRKGMVLPTEFEMSLKSIDSLRSMRNTIAYVHRNGYVINPSVTPFSYKWGTGRYFFQDYQLTNTIGGMTRREFEAMFHCRMTNLPSGWKIDNGYVAPISYCTIKLGMNMFRDAHQYFSSVSKNMESYSELAVDLDDGEFLTDTELFSQIQKIVKEKYNLVSVREMTKAQQCDIARTLHFDYRSSNGQIRRLLNLTQADLEVLFPIVKK